MPADCNDCGVVCVRAHGEADRAANCRCESLCDDGYADCNGVYEDGCEAEWARDLNNCGRCGQCGASESCVGGVCG